MEVRLLGPVELDVAGRPVAMRAAKQRAVLAMLALHANETVSADQLMEGLWGEHPPASAPKLVQQHVSRLRRALAADDGVIVTRGRGYELRIDLDHVDVARFERLMGRGDPRSALDLWRGPALADVADEPFAAPEISRLQELRLGAIEQAVEADLAAGRHRHVVGELSRLVGEYPLSERLRGQLMLALYRCGRQADALEVYRRARAELVETLGVEPGPELRELHTAILQQSPELTAPALPRELTPAGPLLGRERELATLRAAWARARAGADVVVVVCGPVGSGRTRLVAELAAEVSRQGHRVLLDRADSGDGPSLLVVRGATADRVHGMTVAITDDEGIAGARHIRLQPLPPAAIEAIGRRYAPDASIPDLVRRSGGLPGAAHQIAADWAAAEAVRQLAPAADRAATERARLRRAEETLVDSVADVQNARALARRLGARPTVVCPYKGLASFEVADADFFFGRERLVAGMVARLAGSRVLGIVGPSGSGKSSALQAGLLVELAHGVLPGSDRWTQVLLRPGDRPRAALRQAIARCNARARLVVAVDQFEELFTECPHEHERSAFVDELVALAGTDVMVVVAIRADFYGRCAAYPRLARLLGSEHLLVGPMDTHELRRAIELPAERADLHVEPALVDALLGDVEGEPGALPLLSSALLELWQERDGRDLSLAAYRNSGGVRGAVARLAEKAYARLDPTEQVQARRIFLRLTGDDAGGAPVRRRVPLADLGADAAVVVGVLAESRLVTVGDDTAEVAHEALLREWPRLRRWLEEDAEGRRLHRRLAGAAREWQAGGNDPGELYRGVRLASTLDWARGHDPELNDTERAFISASRDASEAEALQARRANRRLRALLAGVLGMLAIAAALGVLFVHQRGEARDRARLADARRLGAQALVEEDRGLSLLEARQAIALYDSPETRGSLFTALLRSPAALGSRQFGRASLNTVAMRPDGQAVVIGDGGSTIRILDPRSGRPLHRSFNAGAPYMRQVVFDPTGSRLCLASIGSLQLLDGHTFRTIARRESDYGRGRAIGVAFSPDGRELVERYEAEGTTFLLRLDARDGRRLGAPVPIGSAGQFADLLAFMPRERGLVTADLDPRARDPATPPPSRAPRIVVRDPRTLRPLRSFPGGGVTGALSRDGRTLALGGPDGRVRFVDLRTGATRTARGGHDGGVLAASFTPDGRSLVTTGRDADVIVWDVRRAAARETFTHSGRAYGLALDPQGRTAFTASEDGSFSAWDLTGRRRLGIRFAAGSGTGDLPATAISGDGRTLVTTRDDGAVSLVDTRTLRSRRLPLDGGPAFGDPAFPAFGAGGSLVVTSLFGLVDRVDSRTGRLTGRFVGHHVDVLPPVTSAGGRTLLTGAPDGARVWDVPSLHRLGPAMTFWTPGSVAISRDGTRSAVTTVGGKIDIVDTRSRRRLARLGVDGSDVVASAFSPDGRVIALGAGDGGVRVFAARHWKPLGPALAAHHGAVDSVAVGAANRLLVTTGNDHQVRLWDVAGERPLGPPLPGPAGVDAAASFTPDGRRLFVVYADGVGYRWDVRPAAWARRACAVAGRRLTRAEWRELLPGRRYAPAC